MEYCIQNQRKAPFKGWHGKLRPGDPQPFCAEDGTSGSQALPTGNPPSGHEWATGWNVDGDFLGCDAEGWVYAASFDAQQFHAPADAKDCVRKRRHMRAYIPVNLDTASADAVRAAVLERQPSEASIAESIAAGPVANLPSSISLEIVIHGRESFPMVVTGAETVGWLQTEAAAAYSRKHSLASHQVQVIGLYPMSKGASALDTAQDALEAIAALMTFNPSVTMRLLGRLLVQVEVGPGQIGVVLSTKEKDRPLVKALLAASSGTGATTAAAAAAASTTKSRGFMSRLTGSSSKSPEKAAAGASLAIGGDSPKLLLHTDAVTEGMLLAKVEAERVGFREEIDTSRMTATEVRTALRPLQHLKRHITFVDEPPEGSEEALEGRVGASEGAQTLYTVLVEVLKGDNLRVADVFTSDPFCQLRLAGVSRTTAVKKSTLNPTWNESFAFPLLSLECELLCQLWDDNDQRPNDALGEVRIDLNSLPVNRAPDPSDSAAAAAVTSPLETEEWYPIMSGRGKLKLRIRIQENVLLKVVPADANKLSDSSSSNHNSSSDSPPWTAIPLTDLFVADFSSSKSSTIVPPKPPKKPSKKTKGGTPDRSGSSPSQSKVDLQPATVKFLERAALGAAALQQGDSYGNSNGYSNSGAGESPEQDPTAAAVTRDVAVDLGAVVLSSSGDMSVPAGTAAAVTQYPQSSSCVATRVQLRGKSATTTNSSSSSSSSSSNSSAVLTAVGAVPIVNAVALCEAEIDLMDGSMPMLLHASAAPTGSAAQSASQQLSHTALQASFSTAAVTVSLVTVSSGQSGGTAGVPHRLLPGDAYSYWRWCAALAFATAGVRPPAESRGSGAAALTSAVAEVRAGSQLVGAAECEIAGESLHWEKKDGRATVGSAGESPLTKATTMELTHDHPAAKAYVFTMTVVSAQGLTRQPSSSSSTAYSIAYSSSSSRTVRPYCKVAAGGSAKCTSVVGVINQTATWRKQLSFAVTSEEAQSSGARLEVISHSSSSSITRARDTVLGDTFVSFQNLIPDKEYEETLPLSERLRLLRVQLVSADGLPRSDRVGLSDPYCVLTPVRADGHNIDPEAATSAVQKNTLSPQWNEAFIFGVGTSAEELRGIKVQIWDSDLARRHDLMGEVMLSAEMFSSAEHSVPLDLPIRLAAGVDIAKLKKYGLKETKTDTGVSSLALGTLRVILTEVAAAPVNSGRVTNTATANSSANGAAAAAGNRGTVTVKCCLRTADDVATAWPVKMLVHQAGRKCTEISAAAADRKMLLYYMSLGVNTLNLRSYKPEVETGPTSRALIVDSSPFLRENTSLDNSAAALDARMEVWENQRKKALLGWGSGKKRHLHTEDPRRYTDESGGQRVKALDMLQPPKGLYYSGQWTEGPWQYGEDSFAELASHIASEKPCNDPKGCHVRRRLWTRQLSTVEDSDDIELSGGGSDLPASAHGLKAANDSPGVTAASFAVPSRHAHSGDSGSGSKSLAADANTNNSGRRFSAGATAGLKIELDDVLRVAAISANTLAIEVLLSQGINGTSDSPVVATLIIGPCSAGRLGSLLLERKSLSSARTVLSRLISRIRDLSGEGIPQLSSNGDGSNSTNTVVIVPPTAETLSVARATATAEAVLLLKALLEGAVSIERALLAAQKCYDKGGSSQQHTASALSQVLWARLVRLHAYIRELVAVMSVSGALRFGRCVATADWNALVEEIAREVRDERDREIESEAAQEPPPSATTDNDNDNGDSPSDVAADAETESSVNDSAHAKNSSSSAASTAAVARSIGIVGRLSAALGNTALELLLGANLATLPQVRRALSLAATHVYSRCCDEVGRHLTTATARNAPLSVESLLDLLSFLSRRDDCLSSDSLRSALLALQCPCNDGAVTARKTASSSSGAAGVAYAFEPPALLCAVLPAKGVAEAYAAKAEDRLRAYFDNIVMNSTAELPQGLGPDIEGVQVFEYLDRGADAVVMTVLPGTAMHLLLESYISICERRFPDHAEVQSALLRAVAGALATLRNTVTARVHSVSEVLLPASCESAAVRHHYTTFLCAVANDARWMVQEALPDLEERCQLGADFNEGRASQALSVLTQVWLDLCADCTQRLARLILSSIEYDVGLDGLTRREGETRVHKLRRALTEHFKSLNNRLDSWCYNRCLARCADHLVVRVVEDLLVRAVSGERLSGGDLLRLQEVETLVIRALKECRLDNDSAGAGLYEHRLEFLHEVVRLLTASAATELEPLVKDLMAQHSTCQLSLQHMLEVMVLLRPDGDTDAIPDEARKWSDPDNHMGVDAENESAGGNSGMRDFSELSPHVRLFQKPLAAMKAMHEMRMKIDAPTALSDPRTGLRTLFAQEQDEEPQQKSTWRRLSSPIMPSALTKSASGGATNRRTSAAPTASYHVSSSGSTASSGSGAVAPVVLVSSPTAGSLSLELHVTVERGDGLSETATIGRTYYQCVIDIKSNEGTQRRQTRVKKAPLSSAAPHWHETLSFKLKSLVGAQLEATIWTRSKATGDSQVGTLKIPLTSCPVISEQITSFSENSSSSSSEVHATWYPVEQPRRGRLKLRVQAHEVGELVVI